MENKTLENAVEVDGSELKNSKIDNSETGTINNHETGTVNNYYNEVPATPNIHQLQAQLDRIEQMLHYKIQHIVSK
ncbi:hypothetical protein PTQ27_09175 [Mannheimia sp. AT1]|uniref:Uncharacterized protein n=1 Tax=Mannheimia cairinae TaxID=3025936 RepID=A0ABT5MR14_9PAST|nr:hypothetical protein [Mannheimia cairinae]MDD0824628.1 hypothetical protein [Mannheimia cairinae]MDD0826443.1 hypothetical protein [Mannheimia cairinae]